MQRRPLLLAFFLPALATPATAQRAEFQLLRADYGAGRRRIDVTPVIAQLLQRGQAAQVGNALFGADPAEGQLKRLRVTVRDRRGRERSYEFPEDSWFDPARIAGAAPAGARILHARWGVAGANVDVTPRLRELAQAEQRFQLSNALMGVDPAPGQVKRLRIVVAEGGGRRRSLEFAEGSWVDGGQFAGWSGGQWGNDSGGWDEGWQGPNGPAGPSRPPRLLIEQAEYGADDGRRLDVTQQLNAAAASGRLELVVGNRSLGGDPAPGAPKRLWLRYRVDGGRTREGSWREDERLRLP